MGQTIACEISEGFKNTVHFAHLHAQLHVFRVFRTFDYSKFRDILNIVPHIIERFKKYCQ